MAEAKNQTAAKARTRTAKKAPATSAKATTSKANATKSAAESTPVQARAAAPAAAPAAPAASNGAAKTSQTKVAASAAKPAPAPQPEAGNRISVTIPLDSPLVGVAVKAATLPVTAVKKVARNRNGIPAYAAVGGLAVIGAVEWPVAAVGGLGLAAMRRWGPLKPAVNSQNQDSKKKS